MITLWGLVVLLQGDPQIFEFSILVHTAKECESVRNSLKKHDLGLYRASHCIEMKFPKATVYDEDKKGGAVTPPSRPQKPNVLT